MSFLGSSEEERHGHGRERKECRADSELTRTASFVVKWFDKQFVFTISLHALQLLSHVIGQDCVFDAELIEDRGTDAHQVEEFFSIFDEIAQKWNDDRLTHPAVLYRRIVINESTRIMQQGRFMEDLDIVV